VERLVEVAAVGGITLDLSLPEAFCDLDRFVERWSLPTQNQLEAMRRASSAEERKEFYEAAVPRLSAIIDYLQVRTRIGFAESYD
jgi:hypothetical protein